MSQKNTNFSSCKTYVTLWRWISVVLFLRLLNGFPLFSYLLNLFHVNPTSQVTPSAHVIFSGCVPTKKHRDVTTYHIGMWLPFASRCDNLSHQGTITLHITGAKAEERKCSMTNRETPHDEIKTLHETFANAACPKQNAAWWNWSHGGGRGARSPTIWHEFPCMGKRILRYSLGTFPVRPRHFPCIP